MLLFLVSFLLFFSSRISVANGHRPVVLGDTGPEDPHHNHRQEREQRLEHGAVNLAVCTIANIFADHVVEDLADGEKNGSGGKVDHGAGLAENAKDQNGLEHIESDEKDERH